MSTEEFQRKLTAILSADVKGYSRLMGEDEDSTVRTLTNKTIQEISRVLGVENILEGSVRKAGNALRITAQLIRATDGFHLWSETYNRELRDIFVVQEDIAKAVAEELKVKLGIERSFRGKEIPSY